MICLEEKITPVSHPKLVFTLKHLITWCPASRNCQAVSLFWVFASNIRAICKVTKKVQFSGWRPFVLKGVYWASKMGWGTWALGVGERLLSLIKWGSYSLVNQVQEILLKLTKEMTWYYSLRNHNNISSVNYQSVLGEQAGKKKKEILREREGRQT